MSGPPDRSPDRATTGEASRGDGDGAASAGREPRPLIERIGLAAIALVLGVLFGGVSAASWVGGEPFLAVMAGIGCLMTLWVGAITLVRG